MTGISTSEQEIRAGQRFGFGENWRRFLAVLDDDRIRRAEQSLRDMLKVTTLEGKRFLDVGSGSGLFSLAAHRLGAAVHSFDFDPDSVGCTQELRRRYAPDSTRWVVEQGSALAPAYLHSLGEFDVVYSWGVLHHTGHMMDALANVADRVKSGGILFIAIYNDQGTTSRWWLRVKQAYNRLPRALRWLVLWPAAARLWGPTTVRDLVRGRPFRTWRQYSANVRGMSPWRDVVDWVGGLPFEVATPERIRVFCESRGFRTQTVVSVAPGLGCNEFVFRKE